MSEQIGVIELDINGEVKSKAGEYESFDEAELQKTAKKIIYILQDLKCLQTKCPNLGNYLKMQFKSDKARYEILQGKEIIKLLKYSL